MAKGDDAEDGEGAKGGSKKKLLIIALPVVVLVLAAAWFLVLKPKDDASGAAVVLPEPVPGVIVPLDSITINLAAGHYLKLGIALQPIDAATDIDGSLALDKAIAVFSGQTIDELSTAEGKDAAKEELVNRIKLAYLPHAEITHEEIVAANEEITGGKVTEDDQLTADQVAQRVEELTVQTWVYDVYFTEFVMQ